MTPSFAKEWKYDTFTIKGIDPVTTRKGEKMWVVRTGTTTLVSKDPEHIGKLKVGETYGIEYAPSKWQGGQYRWITLVAPKKKEK